MNFTSRNQEPMHAYLTLSLLLKGWDKPNLHHNKSTNNSLLRFYVFVNPKLTNWYPCQKKNYHYLWTGVYTLFTRPMDKGSNENYSPVINFAPTVTKFCFIALPYDTKFGNCRDKIVDSRAFLSWSLIHGSSWSGLIKLGPGLDSFCCPIRI